MLPLSGGGFTSEKIHDYKDAIKQINIWKDLGLQVGLCHGGFDLTHPGHALHFIAAKKLCDKLVVSVTTDKFVAGRKGSGRPIYDESLRAFIIACFEHVDLVVISDYKTGIEPINLLKPSLYIKGPDFIHKTTPGITAERAAVEDIGGKTVYTTETKLATTNIINYIQNNIKPTLLLILDRDGTIIQNNDFFGQDENWREEISYNNGVIAFILYLQTIAKTTTIMVTNQAGVARKFFTKKRVQEINQAVKDELNARGACVDATAYCTDVDESYAYKHPEMTFDADRVKKVTARKPSPAMVHEALASLQKTKEDFDTILVIGDREEDEGLAKNMNARFLQAGSFNELLKNLHTN